MQDQPTVPERRSRLARLDGLRGLAAMGVVLYHVTSTQAEGVVPVAERLLTSWFTVWGWTLVDLFFVLSGYVFAHVYAAPGSLRRSGALGDFWIARLARLWPLHAVTLAGVALFAWGGVNDGPHFLLNLMLLQGFEVGTPLNFNTVSWSLSIEMMAYAIFALGAFAGDRVLMWVSVVAVVGSGWWLGIMGQPGGPWLGELIPRGLLGFFAGQLLWRARGATVLLPWPVPALALLAGLWLQTRTYSPLLPMALLGWPAAVVLALRMPVLQRKPIGWLGERSFGLYMVHLPLLRAFALVPGVHALRGGGFLLWQMLLLTLTLIAADLAYRIVEMPARQAIREAWAGRRAAGRVAYA